jgi:hypothetical protein
VEVLSLQASGLALIVADSGEGQEIAGIDVVADLRRLPNGILQLSHLATLVLV